MKKTTKRALSFLLTFVMLLSTMSVGFFGISAIAADVNVANDHNAVVVVPETVYLTPNGGAATAGQYYVNNTLSADGKTVSTDAVSNAVSANIYFYVPGAKDFSMEVSAVESGYGDIQLSYSSLRGGYNGELIFDQNQPIGASYGAEFGPNSSGYMKIVDVLGLYIVNGNGVTPGNSITAEWKFTVTMNDGSTRVYYAYSTLYSPHRSVGAVAEARRTGTYNHEISTWITGINGIGNGTKSPLSSGGGDKTTQGIFKYDPLWNGLPGGGSSNSSDDFVTASTTEYYVEAKGTDGSDGTRAIGYLGYITVDSSRYTKTKQIPNFKIGSDALRVNDGKKDSLDRYYAWYILGDANTRIDSGYGSTPGDGWTQFVNISDTAQTYRHTADIDFDVSTINGKYIHVANHGNCYYMSGTTYSNACVSAVFTTVDKAALRKAVLEGSTLNANNYTSASWSNYQAILRTTAKNLGTPSNTNVDVSALESARNALKTTVKLNANGGSIGTTSFEATVGNKATVDYGVSSYKPTRTGYTFKGWATSSTATSGSTSTVNAGLMPTFYATWEANKYSVVFDNLVDFSKWNTSSANNATISDVTNGGFTLTSNDGVGEGTSTSPFFPVTPGKQYRVDIDITGTAWDVYIFFCDENGAWVDFQDGAANRYSYGGTTGVPVDNAVFTAPNKDSVVKAQIRVDANNGNNTVTFSNIRVYEVGTVEDGVPYTPSQPVTYAGTYGTLPTPTRDGYDFLGWYKADGTQLNAGDTVGASDVYVTSKWKQNGYTITWEVDGQQDVTSIVAAGAMPSYPNGTPTKAATAQYTYTFTGWSPTLAVATADATYTAQFSQTTNKYKVTWIVDGATAKEEYVEYGQTPNFGSTPTKAADDQYTYTFTGWDTTPSAVTKDATYTAQFSNTTRKYTVTWLNSDNSVIRIDNDVPYGTIPTAPADPTKNSTAQYDYEFAGWTPTVDKITGDTTYKATFTPKLRSYTVNWVVNNEVVETDTVEYGKMPEYNGSTPTKQGNAQYSYTFDKWSPTVANVAGDVNYTAQFTETVNKYKVTWYDENGTTELYSAEFEYGATPVYGAENPTKAATAQYTYTFDGWDRAYEAVTEATSYKATYSSTVNEYTIEFVNHDGTVLQSGKVAYDETPSYDGEIPVKAGNAQFSYAFTGWDPAIAKVTGDATYTAQFEESTNVYTVTWKNYDGTELETDENVPYGTMPEYNGATPAKPSTDKYEYTFANKWSPEVDEVTGDVTYTAQFTEKVRKYSVTWKANGTVIYIDEVEYDTVPVYDEVLYGVPEKAADAQYTYTFKGWAPEVSAVTGAVTYVAEFNEILNTYTVTWFDEDGTTVLEKDENVPYGTMPNFDGATPTKKADAQYTYTFDKWTPAVSEVKGNAEYKATYSSTVNTYTVTWKNWDGSVLETDVEVPYGTMPSFDHANPTKAGTDEFTYTFAGWDPEVDTVKGDVIYTATYTEEKNKYTITWIIDGEKETTSVEYGEMPTHADPTKEATAEYTYTFTGWSPEIAAVTGEATYTAQFKATKNSYTITWKNDDGSVIDTTTVEYGVKPTHADATKANTAEYTYRFAGWDPEVVAVTGDAEYTAKFNATKNKYTITWLDDEGNKIDTTTVEYGVVPTHDDVTKANTAEYTYTFAGWEPEVKSVTGDATYKATFTAEKNKYTITWKNDDGSVIDTTTVEYGAVPTHADAVKDRTPEYTYTFAGWTPAVVSVTGDAEYTAQFTATKNKYTVTWVDEDGTELEKDENVPYGETPKYDSEQPSKEADAQYTYAFAGWTPSVSTVTGNATYTATYSKTVNSYEIKWIVNGNTVRTDILEYGEMPAFGEDPTKAATDEYTYTFKGWDKEVVAVTGSATYTAEFTPEKRSYTITWQNEDGSVIDTTTVEYGTVPTHADASKANTAEYTYKFDKWTPEVVAVTGPATYKATFTETPNVYTITWVGYNKTVTTEVAYGAQIVEPDVPEQPGFIGVWENVPQTMPAEDITINAKYSQNVITVTWVVDGVTVKTDAVEYTYRPEYTGVTPVKAPSNTEVYEFIGWSETENGEIITEFPKASAETGNKIYHAVFEGTTRYYTITWKNGNDIIYSDDTLEYGETPEYNHTEHGTPTKAATAQYTYTFSGWDPEVVAVTEDATYTAQFDADVNYYTVTWIVDGKTEKVEEVAYGDTPTFGADPTKAATAQYTYTFAGWNPEVSSVTGNVTYTAKFNATVNKYTVTWVDEDGKTILETDTGVEYGTKPSFDKAEPTKAATAQYTYTFAGWEGLEDTTTVTGNMTFTAKYSSVVNNYTVTWVIDGKTETQTYAYGETPSHAAPTKAADVQYTYTFAGWDKELVEVTGDVTYTAKFDKTLNKYTVTWIIDGVSETETYEYGTIPSHADPEKAADVQYTYTFTGWTPEIEEVTGDATYTAQFDKTLNKYTVTWIIDDVETSEEYDYGTVLTPADPENAADAQYTYTFTGWTPALETVTGDATYTAQFSSTVNTYTVTWDIDGVKTTETYEYGANPDYTGETPERTATAQYTYTFAGWEGLTEETIVTGNVTFKAKFDSTVNKYTIKFLNYDGTELQSGEVAYGSTPAYTGETPVKTGDAQYSYVFSGWTPAVSAVTGAAEYTAKFEQVVNKYTVTWVVEGKTVETDSNVPYGTDPVYNGSVPTKASTAQYAYTFAGWTPVVSAVTGNVEYTATFTAETRSYTITWKDADGSVIDTTTVEFGTVPTHADPSKAADAQYTYTFAGWDTTPVAVTGDATYTATYTSTINKYTVTWVVEGATVETDENVEYGTTPSYDGETPVKAGDIQYSYTFDKWTPAVSDVTGNVTYTATFTKIVNKYTITWIVNGVETKAQVEYGTVPTFTGSTDKASTNTTVYTFAGWDADLVAVTGDATYTATYTEAVRKYTITWVVNGKSTTEQYEYNAVPSFKGSTDIPATPSTTYVFKGWDKVLVNVTGDATYTAEYDVTVKTYRITWANADGSVIYSEDVEFGKTPEYNKTTYGTPVKESSATEVYTFAGWDKAFAEVTADATYTAKFTSSPRMYTVTWVVDGVIVRTEKIAYNASIPAQMLPADKEGYTVKWDNTLATMPAEDLTITAVYTPKMYPVYWMVDGITVYSASVPYGSAIPEKAVPAKEGHTGKWVNVPATMPAGIVMIEAEYTARSYQVFWKIGDNQNVLTGTYGQDLVVTFDVASLPEDLRITVNGVVLAADKYEYDVAAGTLKIVGTAITGNINIVSKSTSGSVNVLNSIFGGTSSNKNEIIEMRKTYHTTITPDAGNLLPKTVAIYVDGILVTDGYSYDPATGKLTINAEVIVGELEIYAECDENPDYNPSENCDCSCHSKNALVKFFFDIFTFLRKLFGMEQYHYCECGVAHW